MRNADSHIGLGHATRWWWWRWWRWSHKLFSSVLYLIWPQYTAKGANAVGSDTRFMRFYFICVRRRSLSRIFMAATNQEGWRTKRAVHTPGRQCATLLLFKEHIKHICGIIWKTSWKMGAKLWKVREEVGRRTEVNGGVLLCFALRSKQIAFAID